MNQMHGTQQPGGVVGGPPGMGMMMPQSSPQQQQMQAMVHHPSQQHQPQPPEKMDNISKVKSLIGPLRESLSVNVSKNSLFILFKFNLFLRLDNTENFCTTFTT